ncbi:MAG: PadR family transcriptional regulator [Nocardioides sp.]|nr:PadR family transcriptional regulator [Nocardioides sp.]
MKSDALRGHLDAMVLASLEAGPRHGYAISEYLSRRSDGALTVATGTLYPALHRLEKAGWVTSEWSTVTGRRRRTYELTASGQRALGDRRAEWAQTSSVVTAVLGGT